MSSLRRRRLAGLWLGLWILAAGCSQLIQLHVAIAHGDDGHHEAHGLAALVDHHENDAHPDHEHDLSSTVDDLARPGSRLQPLSPSQPIALLPVERQVGAALSSQLSVSDPRPRGTPPGLRNPHILRI